MEAAEETLTYRDGTGPNKKLLLEGKDNYSKDIKNKAQVEAKSDESNYVDMDIKSDGAKTVTVSFTGEANQLSVIKSDGCKQGVNEKIASEEKKDTQIKDADFDQARENGGHASSECSERVQSESDELHYTDMYLNSKTEDEDDAASAVLSDHFGFDTVEDESHYITTHEIQLTELDHDVDYDLGRGTWEFEDDNLVYSFVDYASLESDDTHEGTLILQGKSQAKVQAVVSTEQDESDLCDSDKFASSDESLCKNQRDAGKIHLSIQTSSRAVNEPPALLDSGDRGHFSFVSSGVRAGPLCDRAQYFIPAPGRQHLATKLRRKDINEYSSGASSSISELDDADKEVRNLTAKSFRSLACPYFDTINLSTSSESSISEYGLNKWSAYVDWNYGNISRGKEHSIIAHKTTKLEMNQATDSKTQGRSLADTKSPQGKMHTLDKKEPPIPSSSSSEQIELRGPVQAKQRGVTLNFHCNVETGVHEGTRHPKCFSTQSREAAGTVLARSGCEMQYHHTDATGDTHKRAIFASSLLKNVISKKMQFEKERKMERGEIRDTHSNVSPCFHIKDPDAMKVKTLGRNIQTQTSESGSADEPHFEDSRASSCDPADEHKNRKDDSRTSQKGTQDKRESFSPKAPPSPTHSALDAQKHKMLKDTEVSTCGDKDSNSMLTKLLFVPSYQLLAKDKGFAKEVSLHTPVAGTATAPQKCEKEFKMYSNDNIVKNEAQNGTGKTPEIKICLRSVKENKGCTLNIASLLTPKISYNTVNTLRAAGVARCPILSASDKMPNFTVRDVRDTKCKFQTPIYHVRDVRKLVKSSYRFVALDNSESKNSTAASSAGTVDDITSKTVKQLLPAPIVIKCQSVKTNVKQRRAEETHKQTEAGSSSPKIQTSQSESSTLPSTNTSMSAANKELNPDHLESLSTTETKLIKQRLERISGELVSVERKTEPKIPKQAALEKIRAAVKSMEQLYIFDRNEWKRKNQTMEPITGSHVLSLIASEEKGEAVDTAAGRLTDTERVHQAETYKPHEAKGSMNIMNVPFNSDTFKTPLQQNKVGNESVLCLGNSNKSHISISTVSNSIPHSSTFQTLSTMKSSKTSPMAPLSVKIEPPKCGQVDKGKVRIASTNPSVTQAISDSENYLTIPGLTSEIKLLSSEPGTKAVNINNDETKRTKPLNHKSSPLIMEYPVSQTYHHSAAVPQHVLCFSPTVPTVSPPPLGGHTRSQTQRKMLLDPITGHYYLVDTPVQATKRLYDPDTGQFVDVTMSHSPVSPVTPVTPVPLSLSPLACAPTYMIYPGFIPSPTLTTQAVFHQSPCHSEEATREKFIGKDRNSPVLAERMYYSATGEASQHEQLPVTLGHVTTQGRASSSERTPLISITTPQGPRIIAPPSFDGTTMSFVVEHR